LRDKEYLLFENFINSIETHMSKIDLRSLGSSFLMDAISVIVKFSFSKKSKISNLHIEYSA